MTKESGKDESTVRDSRSAVVAIPFAEMGPGYIMRHLQVHLDGRQALAARQMLLGLDRSGACLESGRRVMTVPDVIRWICEKVGKAIEQNKEDEK